MEIIDMEQKDLRKYVISLVQELHDDKLKRLTEEGSKYNGIVSFFIYSKNLSTVEESKFMYDILAYICYDELDVDEAIVQVVYNIMTGDIR